MRVLTGVILIMPQCRCESIVDPLGKHNPQGIIYFRNDEKKTLTFLLNRGYILITK